MEITEDVIRVLQRSLNALARGSGMPRLVVDGRLGRRTATALIHFLAPRGREGEARLVRALHALGRPMGSANIGNIGE